MSTKFTNNASSKLTQALTADATSMHIQAEDVSKFPVLGAEDFCRLTIVGDHGDHEIVKVTSISSDGTCTIERAQESTTAKEWPIENKVELRITAEYLNSTADNSDITDIKNEINNIVDYIPLDGVTITKSPDGKLQVKDIAIGGNKSDRASIRGFIYDQYVPWYGESSTAANAVTDFDVFTTPGIYHIRWREGTPFEDTEGKTWPVTANNPNVGNGDARFYDGILEVSRISSSSYVSSYTRLQHRLLVTSGAKYNVVFLRSQRVAPGSPWQAWVSQIKSDDIGDGIKNTGGKLSVPEYEGATSSAAATSGLVPPATSAERNNFLRGDGTWQQVDLSDYALKTELTNYLPLKGTAASATKLATARTIRTNLSSTKAASFNGTANITPGVTGVLPVANGGTGSNEEKYLPLTGGTITGALTVNDWLTVQTGVRHNGTSGELLMCSGSTLNDSSSFTLYGNSRTDGNAGMFSIRAKSTSTGSVDFIGRPSGQLTWGGRHIVRHINGIYADADGGVDITGIVPNKAYHSDVLTGTIGGYGGPVTLPNYGTWAYVGTTNYRKWGAGSSDGSSYGGVEPGGTTLNFDDRGTGYLIVRVA